MTPVFSTETNAAITAAKSAAKIALHYFDGDKKIRKKGKTNLVTIADTECESEIKGILGRKFPDYGFLGEEGKVKSAGKNNGLTWIVDPIDGTNNFASNLPIFCHSIGLVLGNLPVAGVVYNPIGKELFVAEKGKGAFLNGKRIFVSKKNNLVDCMIGAGFSYSGGVRKEKTAKSLSNLSGNALSLRMTGSACLDFCSVARGVFGGVFYYELQPWDIAASMLIVEEAGGKVTDVNGKPADVFTGNYAATNNLVHEEFISHLEGFLWKKLL